MTIMIKYISRNQCIFQDLLLECMKRNKENVKTIIYFITKCLQINVTKMWLMAFDNIVK